MKTPFILLLVLSIQANGTSLNTPIETIRPDLTFFFDTGSSTLSFEDHQRLLEHSEHLIKERNLKVTIAGHADERGDYKDNYNLALARAETLKSQLINNGVQQERIITVSYSERKPLSELLPDNRRATIIFAFDSERTQ